MDTTNKPITRQECIDLSEAFARSASWLLKGELQKPARDFPLVGLADYQRAALILRACAWNWAHSNTEG